MLACTRRGIRPGRVQLIYAVELATSQVEASQNRRSCASSPETFAQSFLFRGPGGSSRSSLSVVDRVFSWNPACFRHERGVVGAWPNRRSFLWTSCAGVLVRQRRRSSFTVGTQSLRFTYRIRRMLSCRSNLKEDCFLRTLIASWLADHFHYFLPCMLGASHSLASCF